MIVSGVKRPLSVILAVLIAAPAGFAQASRAGAGASAPTAGPQGLSITVLEGSNAVNSLTLLRSVPPVVEVRDQNDFPVEGATLLFTLPDQGAGGTFPGGGTSFTTRSDSHGQATTPTMAPRLAGKFQIKVTATAGDRKGDTIIYQTNAVGNYTGRALPARPFYRKKLTWIVAGGVAAAAILAIALTHHSGSGSTASTVVITPGTPVFQ